MSFTSSGAAAHLPGVEVDVMSFGAKGNGTADDSPAIRSAIAAVRSAGGGTVNIPANKSPGTYYRCDKDASAPASINIENSVVPIRIKAEAGARLVMEGAGNGGAWSLIRVRASQNVQFIDLTLEMGVIDNQDPDQGADPHHLIHLDNSGSPARDIENIAIVGCSFWYTRGDHVRLWSEAGRKTRYVWIDRCYSDGISTFGGMPTPGHRSFVQVQRNCEYVSVTNNIATRCHKAMIDFEPTGTGPVVGFMVDGNLLINAPIDDTQGASAVALSGNGPTEPNSYSTFRNNILINGGMQMEQLDRCIISGNIVIDGRKHSNPTLHLNGRNSFVRVSGNYLHRTASNTEVQPVVLVQHGGGTTDVPSNVRIEDNDLVQEKYSSVLHVEGCTETLSVKNNRLWYNGANYDGNTNVFHALVETDGKTPACEPTIESNWFGGSGSTRSCIQLAANAGDFSDAVVHGNTMRQAATGLEIIRDNGNTYVIPSLSLQGNRNYCATFWSKPGTLALHPIIAGNKGGVCTFETTATPEGAIAARVGCTAVNVNGSTSTTLYVKTSGTGNTGWTAK
jgi:hypothetical protein